MGAMGKMYADLLSKAGWKKYDTLQIRMWTGADELEPESTSVTSPPNTKNSKRSIPVRILAKYHSFRLIDYLDVPGIKVFKDGHAVARSSDFMIYSVEAEFIDQVVAEFGPCRLHLPKLLVCLL